MNEGEGKLLAVNKVFDDGSGRVDIARAEVRQIVADELQRIQSDPELQHLLQNK